MAMVSSGHFFWSSLSRLEASGNTRVDEPPRYNLRPPAAGHDTGIKASCFQKSLFISPQEDYPLSERLEFGSLGFRLHDGCQGRQEGALL